MSHRSTTHIILPRLSCCITGLHDPMPRWREDIGGVAAAPRLVPSEPLGHYGLEHADRSARKCQGTIVRRLVTSP
jgi:hypothetical protein